MALTPEEITLYTTRLTEAENALHLLTLGGQPRVYVDANGERIEYTAANASRLRAYIMELRVKLGKMTVQGPMRVGML
jgi:hypothetical protein